MNSDTQGGLRQWISLKLELQFVNYLMLTLETKFMSSAKAMSFA